MKLTDEQKDIILSLVIQEIDRTHRLTIQAQKQLNPYLTQLRELNHLICESFEEE